MREISTTVTVGIGSEKHNHDLDYRSTLEHVHERENGVIELIPYRDYRDQINELAKPYIDAYNAKVDARYQAAWDRYNAGEIKTKPRKRDYKHIGEDYYNDHLHDTFHNPRTGKDEELPMWRSVIVGLGDRSDRENGVISEDEACVTLSNVVERFREDFPYFHLLGASLHLDEEGFYHCHIDYKPFFENNIDQGLGIGIGQEAALKAMGFEPEQSIINGRDKVPLRFNAFRNKIYYAVEDALSEHGLRLQYGVSERKEPAKDSSRNIKLEVWQETQDRARELQHQKNVALDVISGDTVSPEGLKDALNAFEQIGSTLEDVKNSPKTVLRDGYKVSFGIFDQLQSSIEQMHNSFASVLQANDILRDNVDVFRQENEDLKIRCAELDRIAHENVNLKIEQAAYRRRQREYEQQLRREQYQRKHYQQRANKMQSLIDVLQEALHALFEMFANRFLVSEEERFLNEMQDKTGMLFQDLNDFNDWYDFMIDEEKKKLELPDQQQTKVKSKGMEL